MTYSTPGLDTITLQTEAAVQGELNRDPTLPRSMLGILVRMVSGAVDGLYGDIEAAAADIIYDTASVSALVRWASFWGLTRKPPSPAIGIVLFTGGGAAVVPQGTLMARADGVQYALDHDVILESGMGEGTVTCLLAGSVTNLGDGAKLNLVSPVAGVSPVVRVSAGLADGADIEPPEELLARLLFRIRETPQGGSVADYESWALGVPGVTRAWAVKGWNGAGTVGVLFMCDDRANPIPQAADVAAVQAALASSEPVLGTSYVVAPTPQPLNLSMHLMPDGTAIRAAVTAALADLVANVCTPGGTLPLTQIYRTISDAAGVVDFTLDAPAANVVAPAGSITTMGAITWW